MKLKKLSEHKNHPRFVYEKEDDVLNIWLSRQRIDYAEQTGDIIVHFTVDNEPVYIEILDASNFLRREAHDLPREIPPYLATRLSNTIRKRLRGAIGRRAGKQKFFSLN